MPMLRLRDRSNRPSPTGAPAPRAPLVRRLRRSLSLAASSAVLSACGTGASIDGDRAFAAYTSSTYTESRVLYLDDPVDGVRRPLLHPYQVREDIQAKIRNAGQDQLAIQNVRRELVDHNEPLGVIVRGVWLPESLKGRHDIAVLLYIDTGRDIEQQPIVVFYQMGVPGGQLLNFQDLLVYFDPRWESSRPPEFRLQVLDVGAERTPRTQSLLTSAAGAMAALGGLVPHPVVPGVELAMEAARQVLENGKNSVLLDYTVQFYSLRSIEAAGDADLGLLREGSWMVVGRPPNTSAEFWRQEIWQDRQSGQLFTPGADGEAIVDAPYFHVAITTDDVQVPQTVLARSAALLRMLSSRDEVGNTAGLENVAIQLSSSIKAFGAERRLKKHRRIEDLVQLVDLLKRATGMNELGDAVILTLDEQRSLEMLLREVTGREDPNFEELMSWWNSDGIVGTLVEDAASRLGFRWSPASTGDWSTQEDANP